MNAKEKKLFAALREFHDDDKKLRKAITSLYKSKDLDMDVALEMIEMIDDEVPKSRARKVTPKPKPPKTPPSTFDYCGGGGGYSTQRC